MTRWEQLAALLTGGNKPNPLLGMMAAQNPLYTADPTQTVDAARAFSQGMSSAAIGAIPGSGVVNAAGIQPRYDENWFIPAGITQGPNIRENLQSGNYLDAGLQGLGILGDAASVGAMASMVPKSQQRRMIRAFHGSPYDFDEFRLDKIGTGEGAQAYGHGLYFAENEKTANAYKAALSQNPFPDGDMRHGAWIMYNAKGEGAAKDFLEKNLAASDAAKAFDDVKGAKSGYTYEVNINADPDKFLDWDKPLSEQPKYVADKLAEVGFKYDKAAANKFDDALLSALNDSGGSQLPPQPRNYEGPDIYRNLGVGANPAYASEKLQQLGIPGIKYLDQGSRGAGTGTRNYVVFDPKTIEILRKYGLLGLASTGGLFANQDGGS